MFSRSLRGPIDLLLSARIVRFLGVGIAATATDFLIFNLAIAGTGDPPAGRVLLANSFAFACGTFVGYMLNARLTFRARSDRGSLARYVIVATTGAALYNGAIIALIRVADPDGLIALNLIKLASVALSATWNFCGFAFFAFRDQRTQTQAATPHEARL